MIIIHAIITIIMLVMFVILNITAPKSFKYINVSLVILLLLVLFAVVASSAYIFEVVN